MPAPVVLTGASSGIGEATARALAASGHRPAAACTLTMTAPAIDAVY
jgi:NADP-dependent 3-hydroxy acid dehydrogenase YdfG